MRIAVNTRFLLKDKLEGFGRFTFETFRRITKKYPEHEFIFFFDRPFDEKYVFESNVKPVVLFPQARHPILFIWWFELAIKNALKKYQVDLFVSPDGYLSLGSGVKQIAVMHDLNFEYYPKDLSWVNRNYYRFFFPRFAKKASRIITVSNFSKKDISEKYQVPTNLIDVAYNGVGENFVPLTEEKKGIVRQKYTDGSKYFVYVGALHPRKNIKRLLQAFELFKTETGSLLKLVLVGGKYWWSAEMENFYSGMKHKEAVIFTGYVSDANLCSLVAAAEAITYVSYFEGFGIPVIEGFKSEVPVLVSNITALPEIAGGAAVEVDPFSVEAIKNGMIKIIDPEHRFKLIEAGKVRAKQFTWENTAEAVWDSIIKVMND